MDGVKVQIMDPNFRRISLTVMLGSESNYSLVDHYVSMRPRPATVTKFLHCGGTYVQVGTLFPEVKLYRVISSWTEV